LRIGVYIEPWISQRAGISVFTEHLTRASENSRNSYVTIGSQQMDVPNEHIQIPKWKASQLNVLKYLGLAKIDLVKHQLDCIIDPGHFACLGLFKGTPRVVIVHDVTPVLMPKFHRAKSVIAHRLFMKRSLKQCNSIITVSQNTRNDVIRYYGCAEKTKSIYPGVRDLSQTEDSGLRQQFDASFILAVGTLEPRKNHKTLIESFDIFCLNDKQTQLYIVGDEGWKVNVHELIKASPNNNRIKYFGYVSKSTLKHLYSHALFSIYVSFYEGFGFPVIESMKMKCPVISSDLGSMKEIAGGAAILVDPQSKNEISNAMFRLATDPQLRHHLINAGIIKGKQFEWSHYITQLDRVIAQYG